MAPSQDAGQNSGQQPWPARVTVYGIANCDTVRRARRELAAAGVEHDFVDWRRKPVEPDVIELWLKRCGSALIQRRARNWAALDEASRQQLERCEDETATAARLLRADPTLMRRPLLSYPDGGIGLGWKDGAPVDRFE